MLLPRQNPRKWLFAAIGAVLFVGVAVAITFWIRGHKTETPAVASAVPSASAVPTEIASADPPEAGPPPLADDEGEITVICDPDPCDLVMVDAKKWDNYPVPYRVKEGKHGVGISKAHYWGDWKLVTVKAGERHEVTFKLTPRPPGTPTPGTTPTRKPGRGRP